MSAKGILKFCAGIGLFMVAFAFLLGMTALLMKEVPKNAFARFATIFIFCNLAVLATLAGLLVFDAPKKRRVSSVRILTPMGWCLVLFTANMMAGVAMIPSAPLALRVSPRILGMLVGLPIFVGGWFVLSGFGYRIWRRAEQSES